MAEIIARNGNEVTHKVTLKLSGSLLEVESIILDACNELGGVATVGSLKATSMYPPKPLRSSHANEPPIRPCEPLRQLERSGRPAGTARCRHRLGDIPPHPCAD